MSPLASLGSAVPADQPDQPDQPDAPDAPAPQRAPEQPGALPQPRRRRRVRWQALLVLLGVAVGGIGQAAAAGTVAAFEAAPKLRHSAVGVESDRVVSALSARRIRDATAVLDRMNTALAKRDLAGYLAAFDEDADLRRRQTAIFHALGRMSFAQMRYGWNDSRWEYRDGEIAAVVHRHYHLKGWDAAPTGEFVPFTFAPRGDRWVVVGDDAPGDHGDGDVLPEETVPEPWAFGDVSVHTTEHVLLVGDRAASRQKDLRRLADRVEEAVADVRSVWSVPTWNGKVVVYALTDPRFLRTWLGDRWNDGERDDDAPAKFDAWVSPVEGMAADGTVRGYPLAGTRMVVTPGLLRFSAQDARIIIRHELTHVATIMQGKQAASWLSEGVAEYTAHRVIGRSGKADGVEALHRRGLPRKMWSDLRRSSYRPELVTEAGDFYSGTDDEMGRRYSEAWFAALYIADEYGEAKLRAFYETATDPSYGNPAGREELALRMVLRTDRATFAKDVGEYARALRRNFQ
jgi:hypothetical protein